jgi:hypothetical protein
MKKKKKKKKETKNLTPTKYTTLYYPHFYMYTFRSFWVIFRETHCYTQNTTALVSSMLEICYAVSRRLTAELHSRSLNFHHA